MECLYWPLSSTLECGGGGGGGVDAIGKLSFFSF